MRVSVCLSAYFCGLNPRTVPQMSLNKFRAPLGYRGLVSCFFRSLGTSSGARAEQTRPSESRRHHYVTKQIVPAVFLFFFIFLFLAVAVDANITVKEAALSPS